MVTYALVIPAYNEEAFLPLFLDSLKSQTMLPVQAVLVNDNSTDGTGEIAKAYASENSWLSVLNVQSEAIHLPGSKVIRAFQKGFDALEKDFDVIVKLDADLILPPDYFEKILEVFQNDPKAGMAGGFAYIEKSGQWVLESLTDQDHIRGAFKAYRKACFEQIGGLRPAMGWDTADELLCKFYGWNVTTLPQLKVKHLKPTGARYDQSARYKQGEAFYTLGYGFWITAIASAKLALRKKKPMMFLDYINGFLKARSSKKEMLVNPDQARFIKKYRWERMREKLF